VALIASSTMTRAVILWPGDRAHIELSFARHALHLHAAATQYMSTACASLAQALGQVLVFDRGLPVSLLPAPLNQDDEDILFSGPIIVDVAHTSPHFVSPNQSLVPVEVYVTMWPRGASGVVTLELDGALLAKLLINPGNVDQDSFEPTVPLPDSLPSATHVVVLRATIGSRIVALSSVTIVIQSSLLPPSKWPHGLPTPEVAYQVALKPPPQTIPSHMISDFTMNHSADVDYMCLPPHPNHNHNHNHNHQNGRVRLLPPPPDTAAISSALALPLTCFRYFWDAEDLSRQNYYPASGIGDNIGSAMRRHFYYYNIMDGYLFEAFDSFGGLRGKEVLIVGSNIPWYESNCVVRGAKPLHWSICRASTTILR
jgi:hypothetical protein